MPVERMPEDELKELARRHVCNEIYVAWNEEMLENSFGAMLALSASSLPASEVEKIGLIYEEISKASERACNGYPMFLSMHLMHVEDVDSFVSHCKRIDEAIKNA